MKNIRNTHVVLLALFIMVAGLGMWSCSQGNNPVDQLCEIFDESTKKVERIDNATSLLDVKGIINPQDARKIITENSDYKLSKKDKLKLKKSFDDLLIVAYKKTLELNGISGLLKSQADSQLELVLSAANQGIDNAETLGDLNPSTLF